MQFTKITSFAAAVLLSLGGCSSIDRGVKSDGGTSGTTTTCYSDNDCASRNCDLSTYECLDRKANGASCYSDSECSSEKCSISTRRCVDLKANGGACYADSECASGRCANSYCASLLAYGEPCDFSSDCASNYCGSNPYPDPATCQ